MQQLGKKMPCFLRASNVVCFVFYPQSAASFKTQCIRQRCVARKRRSTKANPCNTRHLRIEALNEFPTFAECCTMCGGESIPCQQLLETHKWVFRFHRLKVVCTWRTCEMQNVMTVVIVGLWATPRQWLRNRYPCATYSALQAVYDLRFHMSIVQRRGR